MKYFTNRHTKHRQNIIICLPVSVEGDNNQVNFSDIHHVFSVCIWSESALLLGELSLKPESVLRNPETPTAIR